jgi:hypothetical protein
MKPYRDAIKAACQRLAGADTAQAGGGQKTYAVPLSGIARICCINWSIDVEDDDMDLLLMQRAFAAEGRQD